MQTKVVQKLILTVIFSIIFLMVMPVISSAGFFICSYDFNHASAEHISSRYDIVITSLHKASATSQIKLINPSAKIFFYDNALTHSNEFFVYDITNGNKVINDDWGWYLHDISNGNYRSSLANYIALNLEKHPQFDGVFLDDCLYFLKASRFHREGTSDDPILPVGLVNNWKTHMISLIQQIKSAIGPKLLIINSGWYATDYLSYADGQMDENFAHANWEGPDEFLGFGSWKNHLNALQKAVENSKFYLAQSGVSDGATQDQINKLVRYSFCSFLMGVSSNNKYAKHYFCPSLYYRDYYWYSDWETELGKPVSEHYKVAGSSNCYRRDFEHGAVLVNPTDNPSADISLGKGLFTLDAEAVTRIRLGSREGVVLLKHRTSSVLSGAPGTSANK